MSDDATGQCEQILEGSLLPNSVLQRPLSRIRSSPPLGPPPRGLLKLHGNLQSPGTKLLGTMLHARRDPHPPGTPHCLDARFGKALAQTELEGHAPSINTDLLQITRQRDSDAFHHPRPYASPVFPFRHAWDSTVRKATAQWAQQLLESTAKQEEGSRVAGYLRVTNRKGKERAACSSAAAWTTWKLPPSTQMLLLELRAQGTKLAAHRPRAERQVLMAQEELCALCNAARDPHADSCKENFLHCYAFCNSLRGDRERIDAAAAEYLQGHPLHSARTRVGSNRTPLLWRDLQVTTRASLLLGNPPALTSRPPMHVGGKGVSADDWSKGFITALAPLLRTLLQSRNALYDEL
mmetsp:Transcript_29863/g.71981  ORF Transcript_29863/g.71981 Transcript_29863/m.71981 type:complete len:351 (-) Transcript_29863:254-1306(-)